MCEAQAHPKYALHDTSYSASDYYIMYCLHIKTWLQEADTLYTMQDQCINLCYCSI